jgi:hypothetical protein
VHVRDAGPRLPGEDIVLGFGLGEIIVKWRVSDSLSGPTVRPVGWWAGRGAKLSGCQQQADYRGVNRTVLLLG